MKRKHKGEEEIRTLLKLNNQYADSYNLMYAENLSLKHEVNNLKTTLKINKHVIDKICTSHPQSQPLASYNSTKGEDVLSNYHQIVRSPITVNDEGQSHLHKEESSKSLGFSSLSYEELTFLIDKLKEENKTMENFINSQEIKMNQQFDQIKQSESLLLQHNSLLMQENEKLSNELFLVSNKLFYSQSKLKESSSKKVKYEKFHLKEIIISDPQLSLLIVYDDLEKLKESTKDLLHLVENYKSKIESLTKLNESLQSVNIAYRRNLIKRTQELQEYRNKERSKPENVLNSSFSKLKKSVPAKKTKKSALNLQELCLSKDQANMQDENGNRKKNYYETTKVIGCEVALADAMLKRIKNPNNIFNVQYEIGRFGDKYLQNIIYENGLTYKTLNNLSLFKQCEGLVEILEQLIIALNKSNAENEVLQKQIKTLKDEVDFLVARTNLSRRNTLKLTTRDSYFNKNSPNNKRKSVEWMMMSPSISCIIENEFLKAGTNENDLFTLNPQNPLPFLNVVHEENVTHDNKNLESDTDTSV